MKIYKKCVSRLKKHNKMIYLSIIILLTTINVYQTFLIVGKENNFPTTFLRFTNAEYGTPIMQLNKELGYSVPIEAMLIKRTIRGNNSIQFTQKKKIINEYLEDSTKIITINDVDGIKNAMILRLYFDYPRILAVSAITEDGTTIPVQRTEHMKYLDFSSIHYEADKPITIYITADEDYVANEFVFRIRIQKLSNH